MESVTYVVITPNEVYKTKIMPGPGEKMDPFNLDLKLSWTKSSETLFQARFSMKAGSDDSNLRRYVEPPRSRGIPPDYGKTAMEGNKP